MTVPPPEVVVDSGAQELVVNTTKSARSSRIARKILLRLHIGKFSDPGLYLIPIAFNDEKNRYPQKISENW